MAEFMEGKFFTYAILGLYSLRAIGYASGGHWGPMGYWLSAMCITISAEFLIARFP